jgi:hypothetical protein
MKPAIACLAVIAAATAGCLSSPVQKNTASTAPCTEPRPISVEKVDGDERIKLVGVRLGDALRHWSQLRPALQYVFDNESAAQACWVAVWSLDDYDRFLALIDQETRAGYGSLTSEKRDGVWHIARLD